MKRSEEERREKREREKGKDVQSFQVLVFGIFFWLCRDKLSILYMEFIVSSRQKPQASTGALHRSPRLITHLMSAIDAFTTAPSSRDTNR